MACGTDAGEQRPARQRADREARTFPYRRLEIRIGDARHRRPQQGHGLFENDFLVAAVRRQEIDDVAPGGRHARAPQRHQQLVASLRGAPASEDEPFRVKSRKDIGKGLGCSAKRRDPNYDRARKLSSQPHGQFPEAKRRRRCAHVVTDDDDRSLLCSHQPELARAK
jgi:hypothetical protein